MKGHKSSLRHVVGPVAAALDASIFGDQGHSLRLAATSPTEEASVTSHASLLSLPASPPPKRKDHTGSRNDMMGGPAPPTERGPTTSTYLTQRDASLCQRTAIYLAPRATETLYEYSRAGPVQAQKAKAPSLSERTRTLQPTRQGTRGESKKRVPIVKGGQKIWKGAVKRNSIIHLGVSSCLASSWPRQRHPPASRLFFLLLRMVLPRSYSSRRAARHDDSCLARRARSSRGQGKQIGQRESSPTFSRLNRILEEQAFPSLPFSPPGPRSLVEEVYLIVRLVLPCPAWCVAKRGGQGE